MSEEHEESTAERLMRERREELFGENTEENGYRDVSLSEVEAEFFQLQRESHHLRVWIDAFQLASYSFVRQKVDTSEEVALFHGNCFRTVHQVLLSVGATEEEIHRYMFGEADEDDLAVVYARKCTEFASKAVEVQDAVTEMQEASNPWLKLQRAAVDARNKEEKEAEASRAEERRKNAN
jgi:hypothetical protein